MLQVISKYAECRFIVGPTLNDLHLRKSICNINRKVNRSQVILALKTTILYIEIVYIEWRPLLPKKIMTS